MAGEYADRVQGIAGTGGDPINVTIVGSAGTIATNVAQWGGVATSLGQKVMASSVPVTIASNQSAIPVSQSGAPWSVTIPTPVPVTDNGGSLTVDTPQLPAALVGGRLDVNVGNTPAINLAQWNGVAPDAAAAASDAMAIAPVSPFVKAILAVLNASTGNTERAQAADADNKAATGLLAVGQMLFDGTNWDRVRGNTTSGQRVGLDRITVVQAGNPAANTALTLTLPAPGAGLFHYITHIYIARVATAALAGGAILEITTTNLNAIRWVTGNQASITVSTFDGNVVTDQDYAHPLRSAVANTATTIVMPAPGAAVSWRAWCAYYIAP